MMVQQDAPNPGVTRGPSKGNITSVCWCWGCWRPQLEEQGQGAGTEGARAAWKEARSR